MVMTRVATGVGSVILQRASRYERLAMRARANPTLTTLGHTVAALFVVLGMLDVISTNWAISVGAIEMNQVMVKLMEWFGVFWYVPKLSLQALVAAMIVWSPNRITILIMTAMCGWTSSIVTNNFIIAYTLS